MNMPPLDEAYFVWLYSQVGSVELKNLSKTYWKLLKFFHMREFTWSSQTMERDGNRAQDGRDLRNQFLRETGTPMDEPGWMDEGCSFLELLIALSWKLAWDGDGEAQDWFWVLIDNLGLTEYTDANPPEQYIIDRIIDKVIEREYGQNGAGGLFPLQHPRDDQRNVELFYQAEAYLLERL